MAKGQRVIQRMIQQGVSRALARAQPTARGLGGPRVDHGLGRGAPAGERSATQPFRRAERPAPSLQ